MNVNGRLSGDTHPNRSPLARESSVRILSITGGIPARSTCDAALVPLGPKRLLKALNDPFGH
jgi:hypothetical protein